MEASGEQPELANRSVAVFPTDSDFHSGEELLLRIHQSLQLSTLSDPLKLDSPVVDDDPPMGTVAQEMQNRCLKRDMDEKARSLASKSTSHEARELKQSDDEDIYHLALQEVVNEVLRREELNEAVREGTASLEASYEELQYRDLRRFIDEAVRNHVWKTDEAREISKDHEEDGKDEIWDGLHSMDDKGVSKKGSVHKYEVEDENWIENGTIKDVGNDGDGSYHEDQNSESQNKYDDGEEDENENDNESVESEVGMVSKNGKFSRHPYPLRPSAEDCSYYMRTGMCKFGWNCKFNHPPTKEKQPSKEKVRQKEDNPERAGQTECKYYLTSGGCKYGKACRYSHSKVKTSVASVLEFNFLGLPIRPGEKECPYYMRTGSCKYESNCRFNHPDPTVVTGSDPTWGYGNGRSASLHGTSPPTITSWSSPKALNGTAPHVQMIFPPTQSMSFPNTEWNRYQASVYPTSETSLPTPPAFAMSNPAADNNFFAHRQQHLAIEEFPERPGQPECSYFLKTGDCKYRSACKFHHPKSWSSKTTPCVLTDRGLPLRPDRNVCIHYNRYGICKFGPACKFDHPVNHGNSVTSAWSGGNNQPPYLGKPATAHVARGATASGNGSESLIQQHVL